MPDHAEPTVLVIFGITGDLAGRYLLPSLYHLFKDGLLHDATEIIGVTRGQTTVDQLFEKVEICVNEIDKVCDPAALAEMRQHTTMRSLDMDDPDHYRALHQQLDELEAEKGVCMTRLFYLSIPPSAYENVVHQLGDHGLSGQCGHGKYSRLLVEKPFGHDLSSAKRLITKTRASFQEEQIYRIDHYLAKQTVRQIVPFRQAHPELETRWNGDNIESVEIVAFEKIGVEGRAKFYEPLGALRDFLQSHLLQVMALTAMEISGSDLQSAKLALLKQIAPASPERAKRGQYKGYREEVEASDSTTETYASVELSIDSPRWQSVPFRIATGKAMAERRSQVLVKLKGGQEICFRIQPDPAIIVRDQEDDLPADHPDSYERVLLNAIAGNRTLFATSQEVLEGWRILQPLLDAWGDNGDGLQLYTPGSDAYNIDQT